MRIIALEEHFVTSDLLEKWRALDPRWQDLALTPASRGETARRLAELDDGRLADIQDAGVDMQVMSLTTPGVQNLGGDDAHALAIATNDVLAEAVHAHPDRLQGLAALATPAPARAASELERAVTTLGFKGAMIFGRTRERNLEHRDFWPIFEAAEALQAPLYLHSQSPPPAVRSAYYDGFGGQIDAAFATFGIGWHYDAGVQLLRLILGGVFDRFPDLQIILGHWGELIVFYLDRLELLVGPASLSQPISEYVRRNVLVTPSGVFSQRYLRWALEVMGSERILFSTDYPFELASDGAARRFLEDADLSDSVREAIASGNWERLSARVGR